MERIRALDLIFRVALMMFSKLPPTFALWRETIKIDVVFISVASQSPCQLLSIVRVPLLDTIKVWHPTLVFVGHLHCASLFKGCIWSASEASFPLLLSFNRDIISTKKIEFNRLKMFSKVKNVLSASDTCEFSPLTANDSESSSASSRYNYSYGSFVASSFRFFRNPFASATSQVKNCDCTLIRISRVVLIREY